MSTTVSSLFTPVNQPTKNPETISASVSETKPGTSPAQDPAQTIKKAGGLVAKLLGVVAKGVEFSGRGVASKITIERTPEAITATTTTRISRPELVKQLIELGQGVKAAVENIDSGIVPVAGHIFTSQDFETLANLARLYTGKNYIEIGEEKSKSSVEPVTENQPVETKTEDKPNEPPIIPEEKRPTTETATSLLDLINLLKRNTSPEIIESLKGLNGDQLKDLLNSVLSDDGGKTPPDDFKPAA